MLGRRTTALALLALASGACGGDGSGPSVPPASCTAGTLALLGELDGQHVDASTVVTSWIFDQIAVPHTLDAPPDGSNLHLEWTVLLSAGGLGGPL